MTDINDVAAEELCHDSMAMRAASYFQIAGTEISLTPSLCKTIDLKVEGDREEIKKQIADKMARCWWMFNEGRYDDVLDSNELSNIFGWEDYQNKCFICYSAMINEEEIEGGTITKTEMFEYLLNNQYYKVNGTYIDYIQSYGGPGAAMVMGDINPEEAYAITFLSKSTDDNSWAIGDWAAVVAIGVGTAVTVGTIACIILEPCGAIIGTGLLLTGGIAASTATAASIGYLEVHAINEIISQLYSEERAVSMVWVSSLESAQMADCVITDVAGE